MRALLQRCGSVGVSCVRSPCPCVPVAAFCARSRLLFAAQRQTDRLAICCVPIPAWVEIAFRAFSNVVRLSGVLGSLWACAFFAGDSDGVTEERGGNSECGMRNSELGYGGWSVRQSALLRKHIGFAMFPAGSTLGLRAPDCAKEPLALWTLFMWLAAMCASRGKQSALLREHFGFAAFSAGSTLGLRAPDCAKEPLALWTLFI